MLCMSWAYPGPSCKSFFGRCPARDFQGQLSTAKQRPPSCDSERPCADRVKLLSSRIALTRAAVHRLLATAPGHTMPPKPHLTISNLPTDVLSCIIQHLQQDVGQRDQTLDDSAALRSMCRSLRHAVDVTVTHASFHANIDVEELRTVTRRCTGMVVAASSLLCSRL